MQHCPTETQPRVQSSAWNSAAENSDARGKGGLPVPPPPPAPAPPSSVKEADCLHLACVCLAEQPEFPRVVRRRARRFTLQEMPSLAKRRPAARGPLRQKRPGEMRWPPPGASRRWSQVNPEGGVATASEAAGEPPGEPGTASPISPSLPWALLSCPACFGSGGTPGTWGCTPSLSNCEPRLAKGKLFIPG